MIKIISNLESGDIGLWYDVSVLDNNILRHCICPYNKCKSFQDAIDFYYSHFHEDYYEIIGIGHHKYSFKDLEALTMCC